MVITIILSIHHETVSLANLIIALQTVFCPFLLKYFAPGLLYTNIRNHIKELYKKMFTPLAGSWFSNLTLNLWETKVVFHASNCPSTIILNRSWSWHISVGVLYPPGSLCRALLVSMKTTRGPSRLQITNRSNRWADSHFPPTLLQMLLSSQEAKKNQGEQRFTNCPKHGLLSSDFCEMGSSSK